LFSTYSPCVECSKMIISVGFHCLRILKTVLKSWLKQRLLCKEWKKVSCSHG
jgi:deoxycytidylate deaminase